ncbi:MAG: amino acid ABC transporter permease [Anaerolineae bacterium]
MKQDQTIEIPSQQPRLAPALGQLSNWPWWMLVIILIGLFIAFKIVTDAQMKTIFFAIAKGIRVTFTVTFSAYALAIVLGLLLGFGRVSKNRIAYNLSTFYVEVIRGVPMLVLLMYIAFVAVPLGVTGVNTFGKWLVSLDLGFGEFLASVTTRNVDNTIRVIFGLGIAYAAFSAEIFRAGIESIEKGQIDAARALGMNYFQAMRLVILPQAIRRVLPALGNDFVAMVKDSSLVSVLGVQDITQLSKLYAASTFLFFQVYSILAFIYLIITIMLTRGVRWLERSMSVE